MVGVRPVLKAWASPDELSIDTQDGVGSFSDVLRDTFLVEHVLFPITRGGELALRAVFRLAASLFAAVSAACTLLWVGSKICTDCSAGVAIGILVASAFSWAVVVSESVLQMIPRYWKTHDDNAVAIFDASNWQDMDTPEGARLQPLSEGIEVDSDCGPEPVDVPPLRLTEQQVCQRSVLPVSIAPEKGGSEALPAPACPRNLPPLPKRGGGETLQKPPSFPPPSLLRGPVAKIAGWQRLSPPNKKLKDFANRRRCAVARGTSKLSERCQRPLCSGLRELRHLHLPVHFGGVLQIGHLHFVGLSFATSWL